MVQSLSVQKGLSAIARLPSHALLIVGQNRHLKASTYDNFKSKFGEHVDSSAWSRALEKLPETGSLPFYYNQAKLVSVPNTASRHNTPSNSHILTKEIKAAGVPKDVTSLSIVVLCEYAHALASVAAVARAFPVFSRKSAPQTLKEVNIEVVFTDKDDSEISDADMTALSSVSANIRTAARLIDTPANELTTDAFVDEALAIAKHLGVESSVMKGTELRDAGFGGIYHVGKAALEPPAFVVLSHKPEGAKQTYALVGKGIVYDTGGMQIKGKTTMPSMKHDMGGAAAVLSAFACLVESGFAENLHVLLCIAENNISPVANKPDDIITLLSGKTCEINNTDAEGRLVLSDGVYYAKETLKASFILDMATLTGAQAHMTGRHHAALLTSSEHWEDKCVRVGRASGDLVHPMVFCPDMHFGDLASVVADMKNSNMSGKTMGPPSAIAGHFIGSNIEFGADVDWLHLDIAAPAIDGERATGYGVSLVTALLGEHTNSALLKATSS